MILGAAYMLYLYRRVVFGEADQGRSEGHLDLEPAARSRSLRRW